MPRGQRASSLKSFLEDPARPAGTLRYHELQGFLFTIVSAPDLIPPSQWIPIIFDDHEAGYANLDEAKAVLGELMTLYNSVNAALAEDQATLPTDCPFRRDALANLDDRAPVAEWSRGFMRGHRWLEDLWDAYGPEELDDEFAVTLLTLSFFSSRALAEAFLAETGGKGLEAMAKEIRRGFADAVAEYAHLGRSIHKVLMADRAETGSRPKTRTGRNEPCPCGSGRKYKRCCGASA